MVIKLVLWMIRIVNINLLLNESDINFGGSNFEFNTNGRFSFH